MKQFLIVCSMIVLAACSGNKEEKGSLGAKKQELEKLMKERDALLTKISTLENEIGKMDTSVKNEKTKLVEVMALVNQDFSHYIELQGKIITENVYYVTPRGMGDQDKSILVKQ